MRTLFTLACLLLVSTLSYAFSPPSTPAPTQQDDGKSNIIVTIQTRGASDVPLHVNEPKSRTLKLYCGYCHFSNPQYYVNVTVDLEDDMTALDVAQAFLKEFKKVKKEHEGSCFDLCDYDMRVVNNTLFISGIGANHYAGTFFEPTYVGEVGDDFYDNGKPKKSPFCRLDIHEDI